MRRLLLAFAVLAMPSESAWAGPSLERWEHARPGREQLFFPPGLDLAKTVLNCESDGMVTPANSLVLGPGDLAGVVFPLPTSEDVYRIRTASLGFYDAGASFPTDIKLEFYQGDGGGYGFVAGFTLTLAQSAATVELDLRPFKLDVQDQILLLYGEDPRAGAPQIFPAGDASPRCAPAPTCSVFAAAGSSTLVDYGRIDATACPGAPANFQHLDIVAELDVVERALPVTTSSWSALKARY